MATIAFLFDNEEGHLLPSFPLAHALNKAGHRVVFFSIPDNEHLVTEQGFTFSPIFEEYYPPGFNRQVKQRIKENGTRDISLPKYHIDKITRAGGIGQLFKGIEPDLWIISCFLSLEALLLYYRFKIVPVIFTTYLREPGSDIATSCIDEVMRMQGNDASMLLDSIKEAGIRLTSLVSLVSPLLDFYELVACPGDFDFTKPGGKERIRHIGAGVGRKSGAGDDLLKSVKPGAPVIYASLGSQAITYGSVTGHFVRSLLAAMKTDLLRNFHLILSIGAEYDEIDPLTIPDNVTTVKWAPQLDILSISDLAIIHGGLGSIKECIYFGVPMVVVPIYRDQPSNARRVEYHGLGATIKPEDLSEEQLLDKIRFVLYDTRVRDNVRKMQGIFREEEINDAGVELIEQLLVGSRSPV